MSWKVFMNEGGVERLSEKLLCRSVIGRGIKGSYTDGQSAVDNGSGREGIRVWVVLIVECGGPTDERGEERRERRLGLRHKKLDEG